MHSMRGAAQVDLQIAQPTFAINLIARPSNELKNRLVGIQNVFDGLMPEESLFRCPSDSLHLSVYQLVWSRNSNAEEGDSTWSLLEEPTLKSLAEIAAAVKPFVLAKGTLHVGVKAIFLRFSDSLALELLRDRIADVVAPQFPGSHRPAIQHITLQRYQRSVSLVALQSVCAAVPLFVHDWKIERLELVREDIYPSLKTHTCAVYSLG